MACGKTTLGQALGEALAPQGWRFVDLDAAVEQHLGMSVAQAFATLGESAFRHAEAATLRALCAQQCLIVGCGGGTPCQPALMDLMLASGSVVWLQADIDTTLRRLRQAPEGQRPLMSGLSDTALRQRVTSMLQERQPHYARAQLRLDSSHLESAQEIDATVQQCLALLGLAPRHRAQ